MPHLSARDENRASKRPQTYVEIDLAALARNAARWADALDFASGLIVAVKKEAYGHGLLEVARALEGEPRVAALGIATVEEAERLRAAGSRARLIALGTLGQDLERALDAEVELTVTDADDAEIAARAARARGVSARLHWKIDTGMTRLGRSPEEALASAPAMASLDGARVVAIYTHLADAWGDPAGGRAQLARLMDFLERAAPAGFGADLPIHVGGCDALALRGDLARLARPAMARVGIGFYGYHPGIADLEPAMNFVSRVIYRRRAPAGARVSYGGTFTLARESELALVGAGYGNGYPRALSNRGEVAIGGRRYPILGRVCMDQVIVDVTDAPDPAAIKIGEPVLLFGRAGEGVRLGADEVAAAAGTISYELLCLAGGMNPRF